MKKLKFQLQIYLIKLSKDDIIIPNGRVAQLGERCIRIAEAEGSTLPSCPPVEELDTKSVIKSCANLKSAARQKNTDIIVKAPY